MSYQWMKNGANIAGATSDTLILTGVSANSAGTYTVKITNAGGSVTSSGATLTIYLPPAISTQPQSKAVALGQNATFSVAANGSGTISYQWRFNGTAVSGATGSSFTVTNAQTTNAGSYSVAASNPYGTTVSSTAVLTVYLPPTITNQPQSLAVTKGQDVSFSVGATGVSPITYQWYFNGSSLGGDAQSSTYSINSVNSGKAGNFTVVVANPGGSVTSSVATLTVYIAPGIQTQPQDVTVTQGQSASFSVVPNGSSPFGYQWLFNGVALSSATNSALTLASAQPTDAGGYSVAVSNAGGSVTSQVADLTVNVPATITNQPQSQAVAIGQNTTFSVGATGTGTLQYQWYCNGTKKGPQGPNPTLALNNVQTNNAGNYTVVVLNSAGSVTSSVATLTVVAPPTIATPPQSQTIAAGQNATLNVVTAGGTAPLSYQWIFGGVSLSSATDSALTITNFQAANAGSYAVIITNIAGSITSAPAVLTILSSPPVASNLSVTTLQNLATNVTLPATDIDSTNLTFAVLSGPSHGTVTPLNLAVGNVTYTPAHNYNGTDGFTFTVFDGSLYATGTVSVTVVPVVLTPALLTLPASNVTAVAAVLAGTVNPNGTTTAYCFQYGLTTNYGAFSTTNFIPPSGTLPVAASIAGLAPGTTYHYRLVGANSSGVAAGQDATLATLSPQAAPMSSSLSVQSGNMKLSIANAPGLTFTVLATADTALPMSSWTVLGTMTEVTPGQYQFTDPQPPTQQMRFYSIRSF